MHFVQTRGERTTSSGPAGGGRRRVTAVAMFLSLAVALAGGLPLLAGRPAAQKQNQKDKNQAPQSTAVSSPVPTPDGQAIDTLVSQMLAAWQIGDIDMMHKYYSDDVTVVSGSWEPPLMGWANYLRAYQAQRARTQADRLERSNSYTKITGDTAWCTYQWRYTGLVDGTQATAFGHTTLILEKRSGNWLIVLNHTSVVPVSTQDSTQRSSPAVTPHNPESANHPPSGPGA